MRRLLVVLALLAVALPACGGGSKTSSATRTVLTDYDHDEFAVSLMAYSPRLVPVHPGDSIEFKQAWTGEAHTVTFGTLVKGAGDFMRPFLTGQKPIPPGDDEPPELQAALEGIPFFFGDKGANQTAAQPCYLQQGPLPADEKACPRVPQPAFTGREAFYNSGFIPYEGNNGNTFDMKLSKDIAPGDYFFYCLLHGAGMGGYLQVKPTTVAIPSQDAVSRTARREIDTAMKPLIKARKDAQANRWDLPPGAPKVDVLAGALVPDGTLTFGLTDEFYPKKSTAKVGDKVTWLLYGHAVSFRVPKYGPQLRVDPKTHAVELNDQAYNPVGVKVPETEGPGGKLQVIDAGTYDGTKFLSSGVQFNVAFSVAFTKAGTYQYACAIHPRMVGTLVVK
ncbi:MAG: hypothetical protein H0W70_06155 [Actinobacteria bacterium]|nr:hypothetical protein [Actinomycetota bacterium]